MPLRGVRLGKRGGSGGGWFWGRLGRWFFRLVEEGVMEGWGLG